MGLQPWAVLLNHFMVRYPPMSGTRDPTVQTMESGFQHFVVYLQNARQPG